MHPLPTLLLTCAGLGCLTASPAAAQGAVTLSGVVTDSARAPVNGAEVRLMVAGVQSASAYTQADGRYSFTLAAAPAGGQSVVTVRRLGFEPREVAVRGAVVDVVLTATVQKVAAVNVVEEPSERNSRMAQFEARRALKRNGYFLDHKDIEKRRAQRLSDVMRIVPGDTLIPTGTGSAVRFRNCQPLIWVDGVRTPYAELDETVGVNDAGALEVYVSPATVPAQFKDIQNPCGAIVVWTR
jgi:hypothetical protein